MQPTTAAPRRPAEAPTRSRVLSLLVAVLEGCGSDWAWQGPLGSADSWLADDGPKDLDLWWRADGGEAGIEALLQQVLAILPAAVVADARDPRRLRHTSLAVRTDTGLAVVDITHGDLRVGPVLLADAASIQTQGQHLAGAAAAADLLLRPLLRGRLPHPQRLGQARAAWAAAAPDQRATATGTWSRQFGAALAADIAAVLAGGAADDRLVRRVRRRLVGASLAPSALPSTWRQRRTIRPAGRRATPLGLPGNGVVVALVGTDGAGKSTVAADLADDLTGCGFTAASAYFGMARGNLPGVALVRRLLGIGGTQPAAAGTASAPATATELSHPLLRRTAAWYYAVEYWWRYRRMVAPHVRAGRVVLVDRYVYDLRESPWPGSPASGFAERIVPRPDLLVLPDAPDAVIHARKPERPAAEQAAIQQRYRALLGSAPARLGEVVVDTSGNDPDPVAGLVLAVISAAHGQQDRESTRAHRSAGVLAHAGARPA